MRHRMIAAIAVATTLAGAAIAAWQSRDTSNQTAVTPAGSGALTGMIVTDTADPQPVRRATVRLSGEDGSTPRMVGTDDAGRFVFDRLPAGRFTLSASKAGFVQTFHGSTRPGRGPGVPVAVADGQTVDVAIKLLPGAVITGTIRDGRGNPVPGLTVAAVDTRPSGGSASAPVRVVTDDRGIYRVFSLAPGEYLVSALPQLGTGLPRRGGPAGAVTAVTDADVQWARTAGSATARVGAGAAGPPPSASLVGYAPVFYPGTTDAATAATIRVEGGEERAGVDMPVRIVALARLAGALVDPNGQPVTSATVSLVPKRGDQPSPVDALVASGAVALPRATVSATGFAISGVAPGQYTLIARTGSGQRGAVAAEAGMPTLWSVLDLTIDGADRTDLSLRLLPGLRVAGRYVFERGTAPPTDATTLNLSLVATSPIPGVSSTFRAAMRADGTFEVPSLAPGSYLVRADGPATSSGARWILKSAIVNDRDLADRPLQASPGSDDVSNVVVTFTDRAAEISGTLIDASGRPVTRYSIVVFTQDRSLWLPSARRIRSAQPATDGSFAVSGLPAGEYAIAAAEEIQPDDLADPAFLSQLLAASVKVTLAEGDRKRQDLKVGGA